MASIKFIGPVFLADGKSGDNGILDEITDKKSLKEFDGFSYDGVDNLFSTWIADHDDPLLNEVAFSGGLMSFEYLENSDSLTGIIEYTTDKDLSNEQVAALKDYTIGQLLDGIGSNFEQERLCKGGHCPMINAEEIEVAKLS
ncbi:MAG: hypothetical protein COA90_02995 [Gammaproteobacteria bacterium]|nr:MAG: hypothetical protein COA90_02995 [Gammaproteobacteria bacterium]